ncbi:MFS transporter [Micromonospora sp. WMMD882]|uniref:MFS transporter n=1 Tax=Micromonospora sp. WMMD882 TaxID=3015151 RepID=UPI00248C0E73|nr:MFS transporter [Micromonospora sp. WMMD882]WBB78680.1 MFS transporter [Micromonospora sp. WMMD882]
MSKAFATGPHEGAADDADRRAQLARIRLATTLFFGIGGFLFAGWSVRIPAIKEQVQASPGSLGLALLGISGAAVLTMLVTGAMCRRWGSRQVTVASAVLLSLAVVPPTLTHSPLTLGLTLLIFGVGYGAIDVAVNSVAVDLIEAIDRPIMSGLHAANSVGSLVGAGLGAVLAIRLAPLPHMLVAMPLGLLATAWAARLLMSAPLARASRPKPAGPTHGGGGGRHLGMVVALASVVALCAAYSQGAMDNWVPLHIETDLDGNSAAAAAGYATVAGTLTLGRIVGVRLLERFGHVLVVVGGGIVAAGGALLMALSPTLWLVFVGLVITGLGLANIFPTALALAGQRGGPNGIAVASTLGYGGILLAPPTIGFLAESFGLARALTIIAAMLVVAAALSVLVRHEFRRDSEPAAQPATPVAETASST